MEDTNIERMKQDLIAEIDRRIEDKIIEQTNAGLLKKLINEAETTNEAIMIAELGTTYKRTGFHFDKRLEKMTDTIKYFKKNDELSFKTDDKNLTHKLIIGDNYDALQNLLIEYRGKIDMIYIDPPYGKDSMGEFAQTNYENAITRDNLLSMLYPRLILARQLLSDKGVIFCSIDDRNQAYVKGLFDEVFDEGNFVANLIWNTKNASKGVPPVRMITDIHEYILVYARGENFKFNGIARTTDDFSNPDNDSRGLWRKEALVSTISQKTFDIIDPETGDVFNRAWAFSPETIKKMISERRVLFPKSKDGTPLQKKFFDDYINENLPINTQIGTFQSRKATSDLMAIFGGKKLFDFPKPVEMIKFLIEQGSGKDAVVLDFFSGSGTTGQAVLEQNRDDEDSRRRFICVQLPEDLNGQLKTASTTQRPMLEDQIALCEEYQRPCLLSEIAAERLRRVMTGKDFTGKRIAWAVKNKPLGGNLDVYNVTMTSPYSNEPFEMIDETLYGQEKLEAAGKIKWVCENFDGTQASTETDSDYRKRVGG
ncbi:site-specific DNA-methyltransferase [Candidatus Saccharibacteria bacterium]|nr:site-specific DNA-methyltransferase [Candidatus Saccharibacteria bacterium]